MAIIAVQSCCMACRHDGKEGAEHLALLVAIAAFAWLAWLIKQAQSARHAIATGAACQRAEIRCARRKEP